MLTPKWRTEFSKLPALARIIGNSSQSVARIGIFIPIRDSIFVLFAGSAAAKFPPVSHLRPARYDFTLRSRTKTWCPGF